MYESLLLPFAKSSEFAAAAVVRLLLWPRWIQHVHSSAAIGTMVHVVKY
jgi:hypothetical protein